MFSSTTMTFDPLTVNLDASGYYWVPGATRRMSLDGVQFVRFNYDAVANTPGAEVSVWLAGTMYNQDGSIRHNEFMAAGVAVGNDPRLIWSPRERLWEDWGFPEDGREDMLIRALFFGTPNANVTVYWVDLQMVG